MCRQVLLRSRVVDKIAPFSSRAMPRPPCDVFINHRGIDTKRSVAGLLYHHLNRLKLRPFLDSKNMKPGDKLYEKIDTAICNCKVGVAVFSPRYCESYFCLHELALLMESRKRVIPIFCDVKPSELRVKNNGWFCPAKQIERFSWALEEAKYTVGLTFDSSTGIQAKKKGRFLGGSSKFEERQILKDITGAVCPGELLAILGPSGSGKTTLLTALGGRLSGHVEGIISYNGESFSNSMRRRTGFVIQDSILYPHLTVTETLVYTALLRLPNSITKQEKIEQALVVIEQLGLTQCKNSLIGGQHLRGISGGERKRVCIGEELLINPSLLLLDEPTSGLDSTMASRIVFMLWKMSRSGRTIVMSIHQPSSRLFYMFEKILLLSEGHSLYFGKGESVMDYFSSIGYAPSIAMNPSDFLLDLANGVYSGKEGEGIALKQTLISAYENNLLLHLKAQLHSIACECQHGFEDGIFDQWSTTWWQQFEVLLQRSLKERRFESFRGVKIAQIIIVSTLVSLLWCRSYYIEDQVGLLFFYSSFWGFFPLYKAIWTFPKERLMLTKERSSHMYRLSSYFLARIVSDLPMEIALPTMFLTITYWITILRPTFANFLFALSIILFNVFVAQGLGLAIGALVMDTPTANTLGSVLMMASNLAGGYFTSNVPEFMSWVKYFSLIHHTYLLLVRSQFKPDQTYTCGANMSCLAGDIPRIKVMESERSEISVMALAIMFIGFRLVAYLALRNVGVVHK
ncbi:Toll/interleukin-1 receptor homology (TIR) domain [Dillenia turbinata]|uniref:Toll/interleukin-1 receptor homology (TIR) domain n=1 Tax=Dillenia turbinata TaxID=194707 RepID=A0AAN8UL62_9MAGN